MDLYLETFLNETSTVLFVAAAFFSAWQGGFRPALLTIVVVNLCNIFLSHDPHFSLALGVNGPERLGVFTLVSMLVAWLMARRRRAEELLKKTNQELEQRVNARTAALKESNQQLEAFCYTLAHDLRAPLRAMQGFAHLILEDHGAQLDPFGLDCARRISTSSERMGRLIEDLLAVTQLSRIELRVETISLAKVVESAIKNVAPEIENKMAFLSVQAPLAEIIGDASVTHNSVRELILNALKFGRPGTAPHIRIWSEDKRESVRLWVEDNGIGIQEKYHQLVFGVFERLHEMNTYPGTGIGLAIVKKSVERMGGSVGLKSKLGEGSQFWIELPKPPSTI